MGREGSLDEVITLGQNRLGFASGSINRGVASGRVPDNKHQMRQM